MLPAPVEQAQPHCQKLRLPQLLHFPLGEALSPSLPYLIRPCKVGIGPDEQGEEIRVCLCLGSLLEETRLECLPGLHHPTRYKLPLQSCSS